MLSSEESVASVIFVDVLKLLLTILSTRHYLQLLLSAVACSTAPTALAAIDRYFLPAGRSAANPPAAVAAVDRWDRRTDARP